MQSIISYIGLPTYNVARFIGTLMREHLENSRLICEGLNAFHQSDKRYQTSRDGHILVSSDVKSLFTKVLILDIVKY